MQHVVLTIVLDRQFEENVGLCRCQGRDFGNPGSKNG